MRVAEYVICKGRCFYFEHPQSARSLNLEELLQLCQHLDVESVIVHMCRFNLMSAESEGEGLVKKPTRVITNMISIASAIHLHCEGGGTAAGT